jgi:hypothetical protein
MLISPSVRAKQSIVRWSRCRSATLLALVLVFHSCNRPTIDHGSLEIWSNSEPSLCFFFFLTELQNSTTGKAAAAAPSLVRFGWLPESTTHVCSAASLEEDASGNEWVLWRKKDEDEKGRVMERRSRKERRFSCIEFSEKSESIMAEAIELSGANPEACPREKLWSLVQLLLHHANCRPLALSLSLSF